MNVGAGEGRRQNIDDRKSIATGQPSRRSARRQTPTTVKLVLEFVGSERLGTIDAAAAAAAARPQYVTVTKSHWTGLRSKYPVSQTLYPVTTLRSPGLVHYCELAGAGRCSHARGRRRMSPAALPGHHEFCAHTARLVLP